MNRKLIYALLGLPLLLLIGYLAIVPSATRQTFLSEFKHRAASMFGFEPEPVLGVGGQKGLRSEHPEEYGMVPDDEKSSEETTDAQAADTEPAGEK